MYCERQDLVSLAPGGHIMLLACGVRAVPGRRATRRTSELAPPAVRVRAMLRGWSVAESCAGRRVPASQPVVGRRAHVHDVGGEVPAASGAAEETAGPRRSLESILQTAIGNRSRFSTTLIMCLGLGLGLFFAST